MLVYEKHGFSCAKESMTVHVANLHKNTSCRLEDLQAIAHVWAFQQQLFGVMIA